MLFLWFSHQQIPTRFTKSSNSILGIPGLASGWPGCHERHWAPTGHLGNPGISDATVVLVTGEFYPFSYLVGDWNHGILNDFPETVGNWEWNVIPTDEVHHFSDG